MPAPTALDGRPRRSAQTAPATSALNQAGRRVLGAASERMSRSACIRSPALRRLTRSVLRLVASAAHVAKLWPEIDVVRLTGRHWSVVFMGDAYRRRQLELVLFAGEPAVEVTGRARLRALQPAVNRALDEAPLVVCSLPQGLPARWRPTAPLVFRTPVFVDHVMDLGVPLDVQLRGTARQEVRRLVARARGLAITARLVRADVDIERFHREFLEPFLRARHGALAIVDNFEDLAARLRRPDYELVELVCGEQVVGGVVLRFVGPECSSEEVGLRTDVPESIARLLPTQAFLTSMDRARARGCSTFRFGGSHAFYGDPVFRAKRRWGVRTVPRDKLSHPEWTWLARTLPEPLARHLTELGPLAFHDGHSCIVRLRAAGDTHAPLPHADGVEGHLIVSPGLARFVPAPP